jgi:hypothetical protein
MTQLNARIQRLRERQTDRDSKQFFVDAAAGTFTGRAQQDALAYIIRSSSRVPPTYTAKTYEEADRVRNQILAGLNATLFPVEFDHQGSVTNDTHVRFYSDVDLLQLTRRFTFVERAPSPPSPYSGDPVDHLLQQRAATVHVLRAAFPAASVDDSGSKCIAISGGSLARKIDVVPAAWFDTVAWESTRDKTWRGVNVLDSAKRTTTRNMPFHHNALIAERDAATNGRFRGLVRLAKSLKYDADNALDISSYDLTGLCYALPIHHYNATSTTYHPACLQALALFARDLIQNPSQRTGLTVPNGTRELFGSDGITVPALHAWCEEAFALLNDLGSQHTLQAPRYV